MRTDRPLVRAGRICGAKVDRLGHTGHTLQLRARKDEFTVFLDVRELFKLRDRTGDEPARVGLWTKADAVTWFDNFRVATAAE